MFHAASHHLAASQPLSRRAFTTSCALGMLAGMGLAGCGNANTTPGSTPAGSASESGTDGAATTVTTMRVGALKGPTGMGLVGLMDHVGAIRKPEDAGDDSVVGTNPAGIGSLKNTYEFTLAGSADELAPQLIQGDLDVLCVPANLAATLYQKTDGAVQVLCVNTLGVLDIVEVGETITTMADLRGRTLYSAGKGSTPQYALEFLLRQAGVDPTTDATIQWCSEHAECLAALQNDPTAVAMLPQPFATSALTKLEGARIALDLTDVWNEAMADADQPSQLITGVAVARTEFIENFPDAIEEFLDAYATSVDFVNCEPAEAAQLIEAAGIIAAAVAEQAIPYCNIVCETGGAMQADLAGYLQTLFDADPASVGGALPGDAFYYLG